VRWLKSSLGVTPMMPLLPTVLGVIVIDGSRLPARSIVYGVGCPARGDVTAISSLTLRIGFPPASTITSPACNPACAAGEPGSIASMIIGSLGLASGQPYARPSPNTSSEAAM
jgi:hypothetical protein